MFLSSYYQLTYLTCIYRSRPISQHEGFWILKALPRHIDLAGSLSFMYTCDSYTCLQISVHSTQFLGHSVNSVICFGLSHNVLYLMHID